MSNACWKPNLCTEKGSRSHRPRRRLRGGAHLESTDSLCRCLLQQCVRCPSHSSGCKRTALVGPRLSALLARSLEPGSTTSLNPSCHRRNRPKLPR